MQKRFVNIVRNPDTTIVRSKTSIKDVEKAMISPGYLIQSVMFRKSLLVQLYKIKKVNYNSTIFDF